MVPAPDPRAPGGADWNRPRAAGILGWTVGQDSPCSQRAVSSPGTDDLPGEQPIVAEGSEHAAGGAVRFQGDRVRAGATGECERPHRRDSAELGLVWKGAGLREPGWGSPGEGETARHVRAQDAGRAWSRSVKRERLRCAGVLTAWRMVVQPSWEIEGGLHGG